MNWQVPVHLETGEWKLYIVQTSSNAKVIALRTAAKHARIEENQGRGRGTRGPNRRWGKGC